MPEKVTLQGIHPPKRTPAELAPPPVTLDPDHVEHAVRTPDPLPPPAETPEPPSASASADVDDGPTVDDKPAEAEKPAAEKPAPKKRALSVAQKAVIAERTDRILRSARPGSAEYADACRERAEAGLVVPAMKHTEMSLHAFEQFAQLTAADRAAEQRRAARKTGLIVLVGLLGLAAILAVFIVLDRSPSSTASSAAPSATQDKPAVKVPPQKTAETPAAQSAPTPVTTEPSVATEAPKPPTSGALPKPTTTAVTKPTATTPTAKSTSQWDPSWVPK
jgi:hypothetical protein